jgi:hypothetical protein
VWRCASPSIWRKWHWSPYSTQTGHLLTRRKSDTTSTEIGWCMRMEETLLQLKHLARREETLLHLKHLAFNLAGVKRRNDKSIPVVAGVRCHRFGVGSRTGHGSTSSTWEMSDHVIETSFVWKSIR